MFNKTKKCSVITCEKFRYCKRWCEPHYRHWKQHGNPLIRLRKPPGSGNISRFGYKRITINGKYVFEHRVIMEQYLKRKLRPFPYEVVHHKDGNKLNNAIENLELLSLVTHNAHHHKGKTSSFRKYPLNWICSFCKKEFFSNTGCSRKFCSRKCFHKQKNHCV